MQTRKPRSALRTQQLAMIHIAAKQLGLDDDTYRAMLWTIARVSSAGDLDQAGRDAILLHLKQCGWRSTSRRNHPSRYQKGSQPALIRHIWTCLARAGAIDDGSDRALRTYVRHQTATYSANHQGWDDPTLLPTWAAVRLIEQMKNFAARKRVKI